MPQTVHTTEKSGKVVIVNIEGPLASDSSAHFEGLISSLLAEGNLYIAVNFSKVEFISSTGIGAVLFASQTVRQRNGNLVVFSASREIISLFSILNLTKNIVMVPDRKEAVRFLSREISESLSGKNTDIKSENNVTPIKEKTRPVASENGEIIFSNPLIIECAECGSYIRVHKSGDYICPSCHTEFLAKEDGSVVF